MRIPTNHFFIIIFEGRSGSTHLVSCLNSHPSIIVYPELLALGSKYDLASSDNRDVIDVMFDCLLKGGKPESLTPAIANHDYNPIPLSSKQFPQVVGFKTRIHGPEDLPWYDRFSCPIYFFDNDYLRSTLEEHQFLMLRLKRRNLVKGAISWLRALRHRKWHILKHQNPLEAFEVDLDDLMFTLNWLENSQAKHDAFYEQYSGKKDLFFYEDMIQDQQAFFERILSFLGVPLMELKGNIRKNTPDELMLAVSNYEEISQCLAKTRFAMYL